MGTRLLRSILAHDLQASCYQNMNSIQLSVSEMNFDFNPVNKGSEQNVDFSFPLYASFSIFLIFWVLKINDFPKTKFSFGDCLLD